MTDSSIRPKEFPLLMPDQAFDGNEAKNRHAPKSKRWRKIMVFGLSIILSGWATNEMYNVLNVSGLTSLEWVLLVIFALNISWISFAFVTASIGFLAVSATSDAAQHITRSPLRGSTVIVFPIYNEKVEDVFATVESTARSLLNAPGRFEYFILSDTTDPDIALQEEVAVEALRGRLNGQAIVRYRRRTINLHRKSGNIRDFVTRWGGRYDYMVVFDADSYMEPETLMELVRRMDNEPETGLIQTIPQLVGATTLFSRSQQFAAALYGPVLGTGLAWWAQNEGNFWGHNAIIRTRALAESAGLPEIPGRAPFGGTIMSHDFVEAALLRRAGWNVKIAPDIKGSYEQGPPSIIDLVIRDRRWCQGNLQHMAVLLRTRSLAFTSRIHLIIGIFSYLASPLWLLFITVGMLLSLQNIFMTPAYFGDTAALFPSWPVIDSERALKLFVVTMSILFAPKLYGIMFGLISPVWRSTISRWTVLNGVLFETILSVLTAPILMAEQTQAVWRVFRGKDGGWSPQQRDGDGYTLGDTFRHHGKGMLLGIVLTIAAFAISPIYAAWLAPATIGMVFASPLSYWTGLRRSGRFAKEHKIMTTPEEVDPPVSFTASKACSSAYKVLSIPTFEAVLKDHDIQSHRANLADPYWPLFGADVHEPLALARARADRFQIMSEYVNALDGKEKIALLNSPRDLAIISSKFAYQDDREAAE